jgi:hypothetical protein
MSTPNVVPVPATKPAGVGSDVRIVISVVFAVFFGLFALIWNGRLIPNPLNLPLWVGNLVLVPVLAVGISFGLNCLIQYLSCSVITLGSQASRLYLVVIPFYACELFLYMFPSWRWPIEGMAQHTSPDMRRGLSSGFYTFFMALYTQAYMNGSAQICPK